MKRIVIILMVALAFLTVPSVAAQSCGDLKLDYPFNGSATDYSGCGNDGVLNNGVTVHNGFANFSANESYINTTLSSSDSLSGNFTFKTNIALMPDNDKEFLVDYRDAGISWVGWTVKYDQGGNDNLTLNVNDGSDNEVSVSYPDLENGSHHSIIIVHNALDDKAEFYANGVNLANRSLTVSGFSHEKYAILGNRYRYDNNQADIGRGDFQGNMSSTQIFSSINRSDISDSAPANSNPSLSNPVPSDGATSVRSSTDFSVDYSDPDGDTGTVTFYWKNGTMIQENTGVSSGSTTSTSNLDLENGTTYEWFVEASDGSGGQTKAGNFSFTTEESGPLSINITSPNDGEQLFDEDHLVTLNYSASGHDSVKMHFEPVYTPAGENKNYTVSGGSFQVPSMPLNISNNVTVYASNGTHTVQDSISFKNGDDELKVAVLSDPTLENSSDYKARETNRLKDVIQASNGVDFFLPIGDLTRFNSDRTSDAGNVGQWYTFRSAYSRSTSPYLVKGRVLPIPGNHDYDEELPSLDGDCSGCTNLKNYTKYIHRYYVNQSADYMEGADGDSRYTNSYNTVVKNLALINLYGDSPIYNVYEGDFNTDGSTQYADHENATEFYQNSLDQYGDNIVFTQSHEGVWDTVGGSRTESCVGANSNTCDRGTWNWNMDYIHAEVNENQTSGVYGQRADEVDVWASGHMHGFQDYIGKEIYSTNYSTNSFLVAMKSKDPDTPQVSQVYNFEQGSSQVSSRYRESQPNSVSGCWLGSGCSYYTDDQKWYNFSVSQPFAVSDTTAPSLIIDSPVEGETYNSTELDLNVTSDEAVNFTRNVEYRNGSVVLSNKTYNESDTDLNTTLDNLPDGDLTVNVWGEDSAGNIGTASTDFTVDSTPPSISYNPSTTEAGLQTGQDWIYVNISASDNQDLVSVTQEFNGVNSSFANTDGQYYWENHTNLNNGNYTINAFAEDGAGTVSSAGERSIEIDTPEQEFSSYVIDTESEWAQGTNTNMSTSSNPGFLELYYGNGQNTYTNFYFANGTDLWTTDYLTGPKLLFGKNTNTNIHVGEIGATADVTGDNRKEVFFEDENNGEELLYYNPSTSQITRTGLTGIKGLGGIADVGNDGDNDIFLSRNTEGEWGYYDIGSQTYTSLPEAGTGIESLISVGGTGDWDGDGNVDVLYDGEDLNDNNYLAVYDVQAQTDTELVSGGGFGFQSLDIIDYDSDGDLDAVYYSFGGDELESIDTNSNSNTFSSSSDATGFVLDYDQQSGLDIPLAGTFGSLGYYDLNLQSRSTPYSFDDLGDVGGNDDIAYSSNGNYISKTVSYDLDQEWNNISVKNLDRPNNAEVNITVETSNDDFATVNQSQTLTNTTLTEGTNTYTLDELTSGTTSARIKVDYKRGDYDTPSIDGLTLNSATENQPPTIPQQEIKWLNLGSNNQYNELDYTLSDPDGNDIVNRNSPPTGTVTEFTNSSLVIQNFNNVIDYRAEVTDTRGQTGSINSNFTLSETTDFYTPTTGFINNESYQSVSGAISVDIRGGSSIYQFDASRPNGWLETITNGDTSTGTSTTGTVTSNWEWLVDQVSTKNFATEVDPSKESTPDTQYVIRNKQVTHNGGTDFSQLEVQPIQPEVGTCSNCNTRNISINSGQVKNVTFNASGDFLDRQQQFDFTPETSPVVLGIDYIGTRNYQVRETGGFNWNNINITGEVTAPQQCNQFNNTEIDIPDQSFQNYTVGFNCNPGNIGNPTQNVLNISDGSRINISSSDMQINTNETSSSDIVIRTEKDQWQSSNAYDAGSLEAEVEGVTSNSSEVNISDTGSYFRIRVGDIQSSSLYTDDSDWSITYTDTDAPDAGGGGGGGGLPPSDDQVITFGSTTSEEGVESFNVPFGTTVTRELTIRNSRQDTVTAQIEKSEGGICEYVSVEQSIESGTFGNSGVYEMPPAELSSLGNVRRSTETVLVQFSLPSQEQLGENVDMTCSFNTGSSYGTAENLVVEASQGFNLGFLSGEYCIEIPYAELTDNGGVESNPVSVCFAVWQWLLILAGLLAGAVFAYRRI